MKTDELWPGDMHVRREGDSHRLITTGEPDAVPPSRRIRRQNRLGWKHHKGGPCPESMIDGHSSVHIDAVNHPAECGTPEESPGHQAQIHGIAAAKELTAQFSWDRTG